MNYNIAIVGSKSYERIVIYFGVIYGLGTAILLDSNSENSDIKYKLKDSETELVFYSDEIDIQNISKEMSGIKYWIYIGVEVCNFIYLSDVVSYLKGCDIK